MDGRDTLACRRRRYLYLPLMLMVCLVFVVKAVLDCVNEIKGSECHFKVLCLSWAHMQEVRKNSKILVMCAIGGTLDTNVSYRRDKKLFAGE